MDQYFPDLREYDEYREPFLGGGSVAIHVTKKYPTVKVWVNDLYEPLVNFWQILQSDGQKMRDELNQLKYRHPEPVSAKKLFLEAKEYLNHAGKGTEPFHRAVSFYIINKCSFSGLTESSSFSAQASDSNFSMRGIDKLPGYSQIIKNWEITNLSYDKLLDEGSEKSAFIYLDPPYDIKDNLYGKRMLCTRDSIMIVLPQIVILALWIALSVTMPTSWLKTDLKNGTQEFDLTYTMRSVGEYMRDQKQRKELLLFNYGLKGLAELDQSDQKELA